MRIQKVEDAKAIGFDAWEAACKHWRDNADLCIVHKSSSTMYLYISQLTFWGWIRLWFENIRYWRH